MSSPIERDLSASSPPTSLRSQTRPASPPTDLTRRLAILSIALVLLISLLDLTGWVLNITLLKSIRSEWIPMKVITAMCMACAAISLALVRQVPADRGRLLTSKVLAIAVACVGLLTISVYAARLATGVESFLASAPCFELFLAPTTRMALVTATLFLGIGCVLVLLATGSRRAADVAHVLSLPVAVTSYLIPTSYLLDVLNMHTWLNAPVALNTGLAFCFLCVAIFCVRPDTRITSVFTGSQAGGIMARQLLPALLAIPLVIGWLRLYGEHAGIFESEVGVALVAVTYTFLLLFFVWLTARSVNRADEERRVAGQALHETARKLSALYASMTEGVALHRIEYDGSGKPVDYRVSEINPAFETITKIPREQAQGRLASELYGTGSAPYLDIFAKVAETGEPTAFETYFAPMDKSFHVSVFSPDSGLFATVFSDITERKRADEALRKAHDELESRVQERTAALHRTTEALRAERQRFQEVLDVLPAYVVLLSPDYHVPFENRFFRERFGESHGRRCFEYLFGRSEPCEVCESYKALKTEAPHRWEWTGPDGHIYDIYDFPFTDSDGSPLILEMGLDITENKKAEAELEQYRNHLEQLVKERTSQLETANTQLQTEVAERGRAEEELRRSNRDLEQFAYVASHDLQEPLRAVAGFLGLLRRDHGEKLDAAAGEYIQMAVDGATRMQSLINDLLAYSRVGTRGGALRPVSLAAALDQALAALQVRIRETGAVITSDALPVVRADPQQLTQLLQNLIGNAIKFHGPRRPEIHLGSKREAGRWTCWVRDNGIGIDPQYSDRIFLIFQRLHSRSEYPGTGIGLAVCQRIMERHGGRIWVESQVEQGATFFFTLPESGGQA